MNKQQKLMKARMVMMAIGMPLMWGGINEFGDNFILWMLVTGFILCIPFFCWASILIYNLCKGIEEDEKEITRLNEEIKKIDAELERLKNK